MLCSRLLFQPPNRPLSAMYGLCFPPGIQQFFSWIKERLSAARDPYPARREAQAHTSPGAQWESPSGGNGACAVGGMIMPPKGSTQRGLPSGRFFGDFLIGEKVTRGAGRSARISWVQGLCPCINLSRGAEHGKAMLSRSARISWGAGALPAGATRPATSP